MTSFSDLEQRIVRWLRRAAFIREVRKAEAEYAAHAAWSFDDMESLIDHLRA